MSQLHVSRPKLLEIGETSQLAIRVVNEEGISLPLQDSEWRIVSDNPSVVSVSGLQLIGKQIGEAKIAVTLTNGNANESSCQRAWVVKVIAKVEPKVLKKLERPRVLFSNEELHVFKARINNDPVEGINFTAMWEGMLQQADSFLQERSFQVKYPSVSDVMEVSLPLQEPAIIPNPSGYVDYPYWTMFSRAVEERMCTLSTVFLVTGDQRYAEMVKMYLLGLTSFGKWYEFDHRGAEGNLSNAHFVIGAASAYDAVRDVLTEHERNTIAQALLSLGLQPLAIDIDNADMHNIIAAKQVAMMYGAAALYGDSPFAAKYFNQSFDYLISFLDRKQQSCETEGLLYDNVAAKHVWMAADLYRRVTGDTALCHHPYLKDELPERFFRFLSTGGSNTFPNFSDSFYKLDISYMMSMVASHHLHPVAMWYLKQYEVQSQAVLLNLKQLPEAVSPDIYYREKTSCVFPTIGWAALRTGWGEQDHLLGFTSSGSDRGHNHKDQNNLMLNAAGEWLLTNPGYQDYVPGSRADYTTGTVGHNSLLVNGLGQPNYGGGKLVTAWLGPDFEVLQGDASESYGELLETYSRSVLHLRGSYFIVWDEVIMKADTDQAELLFHTMSSLREGTTVLKPGDQVKGNEVLIQGDKASLQLNAIFPLEASIRVAEYAGAESYGPHLILSGEPVGKMRMWVTLLKPSTSGEPLQVTECKELSEMGDLGIKLEAGRTIKDILLLRGIHHKEAVSPVIQYGNMTVLGRAAWFSHRVQEDGKSQLAQFAAWQAAEMNIGQYVSIQAELPLDISVRCTESEWVIHNGNGRNVSLTIRTAGLDEKSWTLLPGEHKLAWPLASREGCVFE